EGEPEQDAHDDEQLENQMRRARADEAGENAHPRILEIAVRRVEIGEEIERACEEDAAVLSGELERAKAGGTRLREGFDALEALRGELGEFPGRERALV